MSRNHYWTMLMPVAFTSTITWFGVFTLVNAYLVKGLHLTNEDWAGMMLWFNGGFIFWLLLAGTVAARLERRQTVTLALVAAGIGYALMAVATRWWLLVPALWLMAYFQAVTNVVFLSLITRHGGDRPGRVMAIYQWLVAAATVVSLVGGGYLMEAGYFRAAFIGIAGLIFLAAALFHRVSRPLAGRDGEAMVGLFSLNRADWRVFSRGAFLPVVLLGICGEAWYFVMINQLFPNLARDRFGLSESSIGWIVAMGRLPSLLSLYFLTLHADRINLRLAYALGIILAAGCAIVVGWAPLVWVLVAAYVLYFAAQGLVWGVNVTAVSGTVPARLRETGMGVMVLAQIGMAMFVSLIQKTMLAYGLSLPWLYTACALLGLVSGTGLAIYAVYRPGTTMALAA